MSTAMLTRNLKQSEFRRRRSKLLMECLEPRTLLTAIAALDQTSVGTPAINEVITPVGPNAAITVNQFNTSTGTLLQAYLSYSTNAHIFIDSDISNPPNQIDVTGSYSGSVTTTLAVTGEAAFPAAALTSSVNQPNTNFTVPADDTLAINVDLTDPKSGNTALTPAAALAAGYVGAATNIAGLATGTGAAFFQESGGGNETATTTKFAKSSAGVTVHYLYVVNGQISGRKFLDSDPSSNADNAGNSGLDNWTINLVGQEFDITSPIDSSVLYVGQAVNTSIQTSGGGLYAFANLKPGTYTVTETQQINFVQTFGSTYNVTIGADGTATVGSLTGNDFGNFPVLPQARITIAPDAINEVGDNHTFTATVQYDDGLPANVGGGDAVSGFADVAGVTVNFTLTSSNGAAAVPASGNDVTDVNGEATITFTSATAGKVVGVATATVNGITVDTDSLTLQIPNSTDAQNPGTDEATKYFVDARIRIDPPQATNPINVEHTFVVTVEQNIGDGAGWVPAPVGTQVTLTLINNTTNEAFVSWQPENGALTPASGTGPLNVTVGTSGKVSVVTNGDLAGSVWLHGAISLDLNETNQTNVDRATGDGKSGDSEDAQKDREGNEGASATIGFWHNKNGQGLIKAAGTALANYLATTFPNLFGAGTGKAFNTLNSGPIHFVNLTGQSGNNVAATFLRFFNVTGAKTYAQVMCTALATYFSGVGNNAGAQKFGFGGDLSTNAITISASQAAALGVSTNTTVGAVLTAANSLMAGKNGVIPPSLFGVFNSVFDQINNQFDIP